VVRVRRERVFVRRRRAVAGAGVLLIGLIAWGTAALLRGGDAGATLRAPQVGHGAGASGVGLAARAPEGPADIYRATTSPTGFSPAVRGIPERVYVPNSESGTVDVIDPRTFRIVNEFSVGRYDQHVNPSWDVRHLYVDNTQSNTLTVIDPRTGKPQKTIPVLDPYNLYFTPDGSKAVVVAESFQRVDFRNPHTWRLIKSVKIPGAGPDHLDFTANGRSFLISTEFSGVVVRVNAVRMRVTGLRFVGGSPVDVKLSPDGKVFYVANQKLNGVSLIDPKTIRQIRFIRTGRGAHGLAVSRDARSLYVSNRLGGSISVISFAKRRVIATWHVGGSPDMLQVSPDGKQLWVSNRFNGTVSVIDTTTGRVLHVINVGSSPHGLTYFPQPGRYCLGHNGVYR
jgi:YVTN family beta-propeller protein